MTASALPGLLGRFYSDDQPRDESGRWGEGGGSGSTRDGDSRVVSSEGGRTTVEFGEDVERWRDTLVAAGTPTGRRLVLVDDVREAAERRLERGFGRALRQIQRQVVAATSETATALVAAGLADDSMVENDETDVDTDDSEWAPWPLASQAVSVNPAGVYDPAWWATAYAQHVRKPLRSFYVASVGQAADVLDVKLHDDDQQVTAAWEKLDDNAEERTGQGLRDFVSSKVQDAVVGGSTVAGLAATLKDEDSGWFSDGRAELLAVGAVAMAWNRATQATATSRREQGRSSTKTWVTMGDDRVRDTHVEMDGQSVDAAEDFLVAGVYPAGGPHDERLPVEEVAGCRCLLDWSADGGDVPDEVASLGDAEAEVIDYEALEERLTGVSAEQAVGDVADTSAADDIDEVVDLRTPRRRLGTLPDLLGQFSEDVEQLHTHGHCRGCGAWLEGRKYCRKCGDGYDGPLLEAGSEAPQPDPPYDGGLSPDTMTGNEDVGGGPGGVDQEDDSAVTTYANTSNGAPPPAAGQVVLTPGAQSAQASDMGLVGWRGVIAVEGKPTGDGRMFRRGSLFWDEGYLPADVFAMLQDPDGGVGHDGSKIAGRIDRIWKEDSATSGYVEVWAEGVYDTSSETGREVLRLQNNGMLTGVSVDVDSVEVVMPDLADEDLLSALLFGSGVEEYSAGRIRRVTVCSIPAFIEARIYPVNDAGSLVAGAGAVGFSGVRAWLPWQSTTSGTLVASGAFAVAAPRQEDVFRSLLVDADPPAETFTRREYREYTPFTVDADGRVSGHVSPWGVCHIGFSDRCVTAPRSSNGYAHARTGHVLTGDGNLVATARVFAQFGPGRRAHAPEELAAAPAVEWYESMCLAVADVAAYEDGFGIQVQGRVRPGISVNQLRAFRASRISPDWRTISGRLECVGFAVVNVTGFTNQALPALVASALGADVDVARGELRGSMFLVGDEVRTLVATGGAGPDVLSDAVAGLLARVEELEDAEFRRQAAAALAGLPTEADEQARLAAEVDALLADLDLGDVTVDAAVEVDGSAGSVSVSVEELATLRAAAEIAARFAAEQAVEVVEVAGGCGCGQMADAAAGDTQTCPGCGLTGIAADATECPRCGAALDGDGQSAAGETSVLAVGPGPDGKCMCGPGAACGGNCENCTCTA